jgi:hypothetical protein
VSGLTPDDEFRCFAEGYWNETRAGNPTRAALNAEALELLVDPWRATGDPAPLLLGLLSDPSAEVRYAAAALLGSAQPAAVSALAALAAGADAWVAPAANTLLVQWGQPPRLTIRRR